MKRDWDVIREILLKTEQLPISGSRVSIGDIEHKDSDLVRYNMRILSQGGMIFGGIDGKGHYAVSLTWEGHETLDRIHAENRWEKIKSIAREKGVGLTLDSIKAIAASFL